jgi:hypothetical protein
VPARAGLVSRRDGTTQFEMRKILSLREGVQVFLECHRLAAKVPR